jgi:hypothetical protein
MKPAIFLTLLIVLLSACAPALTATPVSTQPLAVVETPTRLLSTVEAPSATPTTSETPIISPTSTITPLPTIPTFTPTFDVRTIVTATPAPKAECPKEDDSFMNSMGLELWPNPIAKFISNVDVLLEYLNRGGSFKKLDAEFTKNKIDHIIQDLTNDGHPDLITDAGMFQIPILFYCDRGKYHIFPDGPESELYMSEMGDFMVRDMNKNGIPEVIFYSYYKGLRVEIVEWNGTKFILLNGDTGSGMGLAGKDDFVIADFDNNGVDDFSLYGGLGESFGPWRHITDYNFWNGNEYSSVLLYDPPQYRFQAVNDADEAILMGKYDTGISLYQAVIFDDKLYPWSKSRYQEDLSAGARAYWDPPLTPNPVSDDPAEYPRLAAYAYYRMVILHTFLGEMDAAQVKYATLQEKFPAGNPGHPYVEMATDFWNAYQSSGKLYNACAAAIAYADAHPEILIPLGSDYHGAQSHIYIPADVCPFR